MPKGTGSPEVTKELVAKADHKIPDVLCHLRPCNENAPDDHEECGVEHILNVPQPNGKRRERIAETLAQWQMVSEGGISSSRNRRQTNCVLE